METPVFELAIAILAAAGGGGGASGPLSAADYETVRQKCTALRSQLAADLESRRNSPL